MKYTRAPRHDRQRMALVHMKPGSPVHARWMSYGYSVLASDIGYWARKLRAHADTLSAAAAEPEATLLEQRAARQARRAADRAALAAERARLIWERAHRDSVSGPAATRSKRTTAVGNIYIPYRIVERLIEQEGFSRTER